MTDQHDWSKQQLGKGSGLVLPRACTTKRTWAARVQSSILLAAGLSCFWSAETYAFILFLVSNIYHQGEAQKGFLG